jgi:hypothetical protein
VCKKSGEKGWVKVEHESERETEIERGERGERESYMYGTWRHVLSENFRDNNSLVSLIVLQYDTDSPCGGTHCCIKHVDILSMHNRQTTHTFK